MGGWLPAWLCALPNPSETLCSCSFGLCVGASESSCNKEKVSQNQSRFWSLGHISLKSLKTGPFFPRVTGLNKAGANTRVLVYQRRAFLMWPFRSDPDPETELSLGRLTGSAVLLTASPQDLQLPASRIRTSSQRGLVLRKPGGLLQMEAGGKQSKRGAFVQPELSDSQGGVLKERNHSTGGPSSLS